MEIQQIARKKYLEIEQKVLRPERPWDKKKSPFGQNGPT